MGIKDRLEAQRKNVTHSQLQERLSHSIKNKGGRPKKTEDEKLNKLVQFKMKQRDYNKLKAIASPIPVSSFIYQLIKNEFQKRKNDEKE